MAKGVDAKACKVDIQPRSVAVEFPVGSSASSVFVLDIEHLWGEVDPSGSSFAVLPSKVEVKLAKKAGATVHWAAYEASPSAAALPLPPAAAAPAAAAAAAAAAAGVPTKLAAPYASKRDWSSVDRALREQEAAEKPEGEEALNKLFRDIYAKADESTRRAMNKSFQTSNGTVLSTNWGEVGVKDYEKEATAPDGMVLKKPEI